jgi:hypothetical protein
MVGDAGLIARAQIHQRIAQQPVSDVGIRSETVEVVRFGVRAQAVNTWHLPRYTQ